MSKWADYLISAVQFNVAHTHINKVKVHIDGGESVGSPKETTRQEVIASIKQGYTYFTIFKSADGKWDQGQKVEIIKIDNVEFIKTLADKIKADNLDNLPEF